MTEWSLRILVGALATGGAAVAAYLTYTRFTHTTLACATGGCETVQSSRYAEVAGIPVAILGLGAYTFILATAFSTTDLARAGAAGVALAGTLFAAYLLYVQLAVIDALCHWCLVSDAVLVLLAAATVLRLLGARRVAAGPG